MCVEDSLVLSGGEREGSGGLPAACADPGIQPHELGLRNLN